MCDDRNPRPLRFALFADESDSVLVENNRNLAREISTHFTEAGVTTRGFKPQRYAEEGLLSVRDKHPRDVHDLVASPLDFEHDVLVINAHGCIINKKERKKKECDAKLRPPDSDHRGGFRSGIVFQKRLLMFAKDLAKFPQLPKILCISQSCYGGWEPSFAMAALNGGCKYFLGFRTENANATAKVGHFLKRWADRGGTPNQVVAAFKDYAALAAGCYPVLYYLEGQHLVAMVSASEHAVAGRQACERVLKEATVTYEDFPKVERKRLPEELDLKLNSVPSRSRTIYDEAGASVTKSCD